MGPKDFSMAWAVLRSPFMVSFAVVNLLTKEFAIFVLVSTWVGNVCLFRLTIICLLRDAARHARPPYHSLKGHSFRIGAASPAAAAGLPDWLIKVLGRWSSDCYQLYIRTPRQVLLSAAPRMASILK